MTFRTKVLLAQAPLGLALAMLGLLSAWTIRTLGEHSSHILRDNYRSVLAAQRMKEAIERIDSGAVFILAGRAEAAEPQIRDNVRVFSEELRVQEGNITEAGEREVTREISAAWTDYLSRLARFRALVQKQEQQRGYFESLVPAFRRVKAAADRALTLNQDAMVRKSDRAERSAGKLTQLIFVSTLLVIVFGFWASVWLASRMLRPLRVLGQTVRRFDAGDLEVRARVGAGDEVGELARDFNAMADHLEHYRKSSLGDLLVAQRVAQATVDAFPDPVVVLDSTGGLRNANRSATVTLGIDPESSSALATAPGEIRALLETLRTHVAAGHGPYRPAGFEDAVRVATPDGPRDLLPSAHPVYGETGEVAGVAVVLSDVTRLLRADQLRNDLVAFVAHEFRTPLTSLQMAIHLCAEGAAGPTTEKQADLLVAARGDCERLQDIVNDVLDVSRLHEGKLELALVALEARDLIRQAVESGRELAAQRELRLRGEALPEAGLVLCDPARMRLVFANLIGNAVRYSRPGGEVLLWARRQEQVVRFEIEDDGPGVPAEHQAFVFEKFYRVSSGVGGGTGLGLYIAREIVRAHRGEIGIESATGRGTTVWFTLPAAPELADL
jgi:signal transduction histidine kinase/HAMP domain-containing protein